MIATGWFAGLDEVGLQSYPEEVIRFGLNWVGRVGERKKFFD